MFFFLLVIAKVNLFDLYCPLKQQQNIRGECFLMIIYIHLNK